MQFFFLALFPVAHMGRLSVSVETRAEAYVTLPVAVTQPAAHKNRTSWPYALHRGRTLPLMPKTDKQRSDTNQSNQREFGRS